MNHQNKTVIVTGEKIAGIAQSIEAACIGLIAAIDGPVDAMPCIAKIMSGFSTMLSSTAEEIDAKVVVSCEYIDPDDVAIDAMIRASDQLKIFLARLVNKKAAIDRDCHLNDHHCDSLHDAYEAATTEVASLIEELLIIRSAIIRHDMKAEPMGC